MFEALFGTEMPLALRFFIAFLFVLGLIGGAAYLVRRFGSGALNAAASRGRQPRLAVIDAAPVDGRRRLVLIRRDNVEHLIMIGGPSDIVVEPNIVRAAPAAAARETPPARAGAEPMPRAVLAEGSMWPLQPEPIARAQRPAPIAEESRETRETREPRESREAREPNWPPEPAPRAAGGDRLAGLAADLSRATASAGEQTPPPARPAPAEIRRPAPAAAVAAAPLAPAPTQQPPPQQPPQQQPAEDQNLADMAHRLEAALRRPVPGGEAVPSEPPALTKPVAEPMIRPNAAADMMAMPLGLGQRPVAPADAARAPADPRAAKAPRPEAKQGTKSVYDSLEQEMASLLGRPSGKT